MPTICRAPHFAWQARQKASRFARTDIGRSHACQFIYGGCGNESRSFRIGETIVQFRNRHSVLSNEMVIDSRERKWLISFSGCAQERRTSLHDQLYSGTGWESVCDRCPRFQIPMIVPVVDLATVAAEVTRSSFRSANDIRNAFDFPDRAVEPGCFNQALDLHIARRHRLMSRRCNPQHYSTTSCASASSFSSSCMGRRVVEKSACPELRWKVESGESRS